MVAKNGPDNLDCNIWTKSGPNLETIWTGFLKTGAKIPNKILHPHTRESLLKIVVNKKVYERSCTVHSCTNKITKPWHSLTSYLSRCIAASLAVLPLSCHTALSCYATTFLIAPCLSTRATPLSLCCPSLTAPPLSCCITASLVLLPLYCRASPILSCCPLLLPPPLSLCHHLTCAGWLLHRHLSCRAPAFPIVQHLSSHLSGAGWVLCITASLSLIALPSPSCTASTIAAAAHCRPPPLSSLKHSIIECNRADGSHGGAALMEQQWGPLWQKNMGYRRKMWSGPVHNLDSMSGHAVQIF